MRSRKKSIFELLPTFLILIPMLLVACGEENHNTNTNHPKAADTNTNAGARMQAYQQAEQQLVNDVAWMPMEQETVTFLRKPTVIGFVDNAEGIIRPNDWANVYIRQYV